MYATDRGVVPLYSTIEVYIEIEDVNDNAPLTSQPIYYAVVMENSPKDVSVIQIQAEDPDSSSNEKLTYRITSGNPQNFFAINVKTGEGMLVWLFFFPVVNPPFKLTTLVLAVSFYLFHCVEKSILLSGNSFWKGECSTSLFRYVVTSAEWKWSDLTEIKRLSQEALGLL